MTNKVYIIGRIQNGRFESYRGAIFTTRSEARAYVEDQFNPRSGWTAYEAVDLLSHLNSQAAEGTR